MWSENQTVRLMVIVSLLFQQSEMKVFNWMSEPLLLQPSPAESYLLREMFLPYTVYWNWGSALPQHTLLPHQGHYPTRSYPTRPPQTEIMVERTKILTHTQHHGPSIGEKQALLVEVR
jgi:hypothetical protein